MASSTMIPTITEVIQVSRRLVQVMLRASERTSRANGARLVRFLGGARAAADGLAMTAAVLAARLRIACGLLPDFLAMSAFFELSLFGAADVAPLFSHIGWQEWRDSNPRPSVLETDALPAELHSSRPPKSGGLRTMKQRAARRQALGARGSSPEPGRLAGAPCPGKADRTVAISSAGPARRAASCPGRPRWPAPPVPGPRTSGTGRARRPPPARGPVRSRRSAAARRSARWRSRSLATP